MPGYPVQVPFCRTAEELFLFNFLLQNQDSLFSSVMNDTICILQLTHYLILCQLWTWIPLLSEKSFDL